MRDVFPKVVVPAVSAVVVITTAVLVMTAMGPRSAAAASGPAVNACGCYRVSTGSCLCGPKGKGKCECPGDCEPKGCEEKRAKELDKEIQAETKRAQEAERKQRDEDEARRRKAEQSEANEPAASS